MIKLKPLHRMGPKEFVLRIARAVGIIIAFIVIAGIFLSQPTCSRSLPSDKTVDLQRLEDVVKTLSIDFHPRSYDNPYNLNKTATHIYRHFQKAGGSPKYQFYETDHGRYKNVRCIFGEGNGKRIVIGAHYDTCGDTPGADDNASGIAGLIELAYLIDSNPDVGEIELVAYPLEEPPFFGSEEMGSTFHAQSLVDDEVDVLGVIILEMIGYYSDESGSQGAPMALLKLLYPSRGNFIFVVGQTSQRAFTKQVKVGMKGATELDVYSINAPKAVCGIDFSDHRNYWPHDINAVMITDSSFYRNKNYHTPNDTYETLDYNRMGDTVISVYNALLEMRKKP
jgi:hypothetical protein